MVDDAIVSEGVNCLLVKRKSWNLWINTNHSSLCIAIVWDRLGGNISQLHGWSFPNTTCSVNSWLFS